MHDELISLREASELFGYTQRHVRHLITAGHVWGRKIGRNYVTTRTTLEAYKQSNPRPGRARRD